MTGWTESMCSSYGSVHWSRWCQCPFLRALSCLFSIHRSNFQWPSPAFYYWGIFLLPETTLLFCVHFATFMAHWGCWELEDTWERLWINDSPMTLLLKRDNLKSGVLGGPLVSPAELCSTAESVLSFWGDFPGFISLFLHQYTLYLQSKLLMSRCLSLVLKSI